MIHGHVTHVLNTTDHEGVAVTGHDGLGGSVQRLHGRTTQTVHCLGCAGARQAGQHGDVTGDVHALFFGLVYTAPDLIFGLLNVPARVTLHERLYQLGRQFLGTHVTELAITALAHGSTDRVDDDYVIRIQAHFYISSIRGLGEERLALGGHVFKHLRGFVDATQVRVLVTQRDEFFHAEAVDVAQRTTTEGRKPMP